MQDDLNKKLDKWISGNIAGAAGGKIEFAGIPPPARHGQPQFKKPFKVNPIKQAPQPPRKFKSLRIIPLGGLDEVGKNMMVFEYDQDIVIVDMGLQFPEEDMLGIDYVIPDISYLAGKESRIRGVLITHGHLDHIGAIPYLLPKLNFPPIFTTKLTAGLIKKRLEEFNLEKKVRMYEIDPTKQMRVGNFTIDWFRVNTAFRTVLALFFVRLRGRWFIPAILNLITLRVSSSGGLRENCRTRLSKCNSAVFG